MKITLVRERQNGLRPYSMNLYGDESNYQLISVSGLDPVQAQLNMSTIVGQDGTSYVSSKLNNRNIVIMMAIQGNAEANRLQLYTYFPPKSKIRVQIVTETRNVFIDGYVEYINCNAFEKGIKAQISIICPDPWFHGTAVELEEEMTLEDNDEFYRYSITNNGDTPAPFYLSFDYQGSATGFVLTCTQAAKNAGTLDVTGGNFDDPTWIIVDTGNKTVTYNSGSIIPYLEPTSEFFYLPVGVSTVEIHIHWNGNVGGNGRSQLSFDPLYGGV